MRLKRLELQGFKSFAKRVTFEFEGGISVLVGPNGSGKSNVADAVRWVLGEQSAKALRSRRAEDVIFVGSAGRHALGMAEVSIVLDNGNGQLPLDYTELRVTRRLYRSGEGEYLINGARARRKDVVGLLLRAGLASDGYTVIGQGAVEELVLQRPEERRAVLEQAADVTRHRARVAEARVKLAATEQNLQRCEDLIAELEPHARRLRQQAERAERYFARRAELAAVARAYYRAALAEQARAAAAAAEELAAVSTRSQQLEATLADGEAERGARRDELMGLESQLTQLRQELEALHRERDRQLHALATARERAGFLEARGESLRAEETRLAERWRELSAIVEREQADVDAEATAEGNAQLQALDLQVEQLGAELRRARRRIETLRQEQARLAADRQRIDRELEAERIRQERARQAAAELAARRSALERRLTEGRQRLQALDQEIGVARQRLAEIRAVQAGLQREFGELQQRVSGARQHEQATRSELEVARAALRTLRSALGSTSGQPGDMVVHFATLLEVPTELERALAAALGEWARAEVLNGGPGLSDVLGADGPGRRLYLPADALRGKTDGVERFVQAVAERLDGIWHRCLAEQVGMVNGGAAGWGPLGFTVVVRDLETALLARERLSSLAEWPWQVVTLAGEAVTWFGGAAKGVESRADELVSLRRREAEARERVEQLERELAAAERARTQAEAALAAADERRRDQQAAEAALNAELRLLTRRWEELAGEQRRAEETLRRLPGAPPTVEAKATDPLIQRRTELDASISALMEQEAAASQALPDLQARWERAWAEREAARREIEQRLAEQRARRAALQERLRELERLERQRVKTAEEAASAGAELEEARAAVDAIERQAREIGQRVLALSRRIDELMRRRAEVQEALARIEARTERLRGEVAQVREAREAALLAHQEAAAGLARLQAEAEATAEEWGLAGEGWVQLRLPDGTNEQARATGPDQDDLQIDAASARRRLQALQRELRAHGAVSETVLEEFRQVEERLQFLRHQSADLRQAMRELQAVIDELEGLMRDGLVRAFERVNEAFGTTFASLFGGGTARLVLTDAEDPLEAGVDIVAQPPGKRLQNLMSLSGGERALTSTALIFALLAINPLPFCVLDEVDAALDESNARRFAALLQEYSERTQFIVITHNRATMEKARTLYGISMGGDGVTTVLSLRPAEGRAHASNGQTAHDSESVLQT